MQRGRLAFGLTTAIAVILGTSDASEAKANIGDLLGTKPGDLANGGQFVDADGCGNCHGKGYKGDTTFLPSDTWAGTMMGNAARDPVFFAALSVANQDAAGVGSYCLHCHSPIGFVRGHATPADGSAFDSIDKQGVGCETCHRAVASTTSPPPYVISDAQLFYDDNQAKRGPFTPCDNTGMPAGCAQSSAHELVVEPHIESAAFCGQCHQVTNPDRKLKDAMGADTTFEFPLDTTYAEWLASSYAVAGGPDDKTCQSCHMVKKAGDFPVSSVFGAPLRTDAREHAFVGGNHWGIQAVMAANPERATKYSDAFQLAQDRTLDNLKRAVAVTMTGAHLDGGVTISADVKVENLTGHKFPTGYADSRRAWLALVVVDSNGKETFLTGGYDATTGAIASAPPPRIYRAEHGRWTGGAPAVESHLVLHDAVISDTRIPPKGFVPTATTAIIGPIDYADGAGGYNAFDHATLTVPVPSGVYGNAVLSARVYYQSMTSEYVDFLKTANTTDSHGSDLATIYGATAKAPPILIASSDTTIAFPPMPNGAGGAGGAGGGPSSSSSSMHVRGGGGCACSVEGTDPMGACAALMTAAFLGDSIRRRRSRRRR